jgi:hypothetical protein
MSLCVVRQLQFQNFFFDYQYSQYNTNYRQNTIMNPNFNIPLTYVAKEENPMRKVLKQLQQMPPKLN